MTRPACARDRRAAFPNLGEFAMTRPLSPQLLRTVVLLASWCSVAGFAGSAGACDTPVYRYAMYRWHPAPYELYCFHDTQPDAEAQAVAAAVEQHVAAGAAPANLAFLPVDVAPDGQFRDGPPDIKEAWDKRSTKQTPWYLISSPAGVHLFEGSVSAHDIATLIDSPGRQAVGQLLAEGRAGVYVLVTTDDQAKSEAAEQVIRGAIDDVAAGKVQLYSTVLGSDDDAAPAPDINFGLVTVARDDAGEKWFLDCLLALEPDLRSATEPIAFLVYGRGRALFSSLGKGIHRDNLVPDMEFITGACSCMVKEQNPGVDLLMKFDWDAVADSLMQQFGREEGSPYRFSGDALFPELIIPAEDPLTSSGDDAAVTTAAELTAPATMEEVAATSAAELSTADAMPTAASLEDPPVQQLAVNSPPPIASEDHAAVSTANPWRAVLWVGGGLAGALVILFGITFLILRPR